SGEVAGDLGPRLPAVPGHVHESVVRAYPDHIGIRRGEGDRENRVVGLGAGDVVVDGTTARHLLRLVVPGEVGADRRPVIAAVGGLEHHIGAQVHRIRVPRRYGNG